jgi:hypothetical protein
VRRFERSCGLFALCRLDRGLLLGQINQVINDIGILQPVVGKSWVSLPPPVKPISVSRVI